MKSNNKSSSVLLSHNETSSSWRVAANLFASFSLVSLQKHESITSYHLISSWKALPSICPLRKREPVQVRPHDTQTLYGATPQNRTCPSRSTEVRSLCHLSESDGPAVPSGFWRRSEVKNPFVVLRSSKPHSVTVHFRITNDKRSKAQEVETNIFPVTKMTTNGG